ncbi:GAP family protein [Miltoncostaea oceani]|uniref:GAP family protein n=1 Tax=Miltoncostaea oceani TaxID=2843216 RepID=UPI001C3DE21A|nr:GAP family protein [Miltoncostaea oceani]
MGVAIGQSLPFAVGLALSPFPLVAMVLILGAPGGRATGAVFALASVVGVAAVGVVVLLLAGDEAATGSGRPATWVSVLRLAIGLGLVALAASKWRGRPAPGDTPALPGWMGRIDGLRPGGAAGMGLLLSALNPKNLALAVAGSAAIAQAELPAGSAAVALALFVVVATLGVTAPLAMSVVLGHRGDRVLAAVKDGMVRHNDVILAVLALVIGATLIGDAISGFSA